MDFVNGKFKNQDLTLIMTLHHLPLLTTISYSPLLLSLKFPLHPLKNVNIKDLTP